jgi:iron complex outermembrane receptor protein
MRQKYSTPIKLQLSAAALLISMSGVLHANELDPALDMDLSSLLDLEVTSVSKAAEPLSQAAAAIYVITQEQLETRGVTSIPEALKTVPGLHVVQLDSHKWAISSRGFNGRYNNKMLVLIDGRVQYSPEYSGVYWETTDTLIQDIDRIEVIRGPAAALWGLNAVNGVINITTKHTLETLGGYAEIGSGSDEHFAGFRYGAQLSDRTAVRGYAKGRKVDGASSHSEEQSPTVQSQINALGADNDYWQQQIGARFDTTLDSSSDLMVSFDAYNIKAEDGLITGTQVYIPETVKTRGWNLLANFGKALSTRSEIDITTYFDFAARDGQFISFSRDTFDFELKHHFTTDNHRLLTGLEYRYVSNNLSLNDQVISTPNPNENTQLYSLFISDQWTLVDEKLWLTLAGRLDKHNYADNEFQPSLRLSWKATPSQTVWTALSRAVRLPAQLELYNHVSIGVAEGNTALNPLPFPVALNTLSNTDYDVEEVKSLEIGHRIQVNPQLTVDTTAFYNDYEDLRSFSLVNSNIVMPPALSSLDFAFTNNGAGHNHGFETSINWHANTQLRFELNYSYINGAFSEGLPQVTDAPENIVSLSSYWSPTPSLDIHAAFRYVDELETFSQSTLEFVTLEDFFTADIDIAWKVNKQLTLSAHGRNLFENNHEAFIPEIVYSHYSIEPSFFAKLSYSF